MAELDFEIKLKNYEIVSKDGETVLRIKAKDVNITEVIDNFFVSEVVEALDATIRGLYYKRGYYKMLWKRGYP